MSENETMELRKVARVYLGPSEHDAVENWRRAQPKIPSRSEALRQLVEHALAQHQSGAA